MPLTENAIKQIETAVTAVYTEVDEVLPANKTWEQADSELLAVYRNVIREQQNVSFLGAHKVKLLYRIKQAKSKGKITWGGVKIFGELDQMFHRYEAMIWVDRESWVCYPNSREAMVHHYASYLMWDDEKEKMTTISPDFSDFAAVVKAHGDWRQELRPLANTPLGGLLESAEGDEDE